MSDEPLLPTPVPLMSAVKARNLARECQGMAIHLREAGDTATARLLEQRSAWWLAYAISLSMIPPGAIDDDGRWIMKFVWLPVVGVVCLAIGAAIGAVWMAVRLTAEDLPDPPP
jgi:hypothetical protein